MMLTVNGVPIHPDDLSDLKPGKRFFVVGERTLTGATMVARIRRTSPVNSRGKVQLQGDLGLIGEGGDARVRQVLGAIEVAVVGGRITLRTIDINDMAADAFARELLWTLATQRVTHGKH